MAFPVRQSLTTTNWSSSPTDHFAAYPTTVSAGHLAVLIFQHRATGGAVVSSDPSGYSSIVTAASNGNNRGYAWAKKMVGDEGGGSINIVTDQGKNAEAHLYIISGWRDSGTILNDVEAAPFATFSSSAAPNPPLLNPANWGQEDTKYIAAAIYCGDDNATTTTGYPSLFSDGTVHPTTVGFTGHAIASAHFNYSDADNLDPDAFTLDGTTAGLALTIAIRPAAVAVSDPPFRSPSPSQVAALVRSPRPLFGWSRSLVSGLLVPAHADVALVTV